MKNFRKVLALILVVATLFSFVAMASAKEASEFGDYADVQNKLAVDIIAALGITVGDNGNYRPADTIDRDEVAAMIARLRNGGKFDAALYVGAPNVFADVKGQWSEGYVTYCAQLGIINGLNETTFNPNGKITVVDTLKLLLCVLGYDAKLSGYVGPNYRVAVVRDADKMGLTTGIASADMFKEATRDQVALMFFNALKARLVYGYVSENIVTITNALLGTKFYDGITSVTLPALTDAEIANCNAVISNVKLMDVLGIDYATTYDCYKRPGTTWYVGSSWKKFYKDAPVASYTDGTNPKPADKAVVDVYVNGQKCTEDYTALLGKGVVAEAYAVEGGVRIVLIDTFMTSVVSTSARYASATLANGRTIKNLYGLAAGDVIAFHLCDGTCGAKVDANKVLKDWHYGDFMHDLTVVTPEDIYVAEAHRVTKTPANSYIQNKDGKIYYSKNINHELASNLYTNGIDPYMTHVAAGENVRVYRDAYGYIQYWTVVPTEGGAAPKVGILQGGSNKAVMKDTYVDTDKLVDYTYTADVLDMNGVDVANISVTKDTYDFMVADKTADDVGVNDIYGEKEDRLVVYDADGAVVKYSTYAGVNTVLNEVTGELEGEKWTNGENYHFNANTQYLVRIYDFATGESKYEAVSGYKAIAPYIGNVTMGNMEKKNVVQYLDTDDNGIIDYLFIEAFYKNISAEYVYITGIEENVGVDYLKGYFAAFDLYGAWVNGEKAYVAYYDIYAGGELKANTLYQTTAQAVTATYGGAPIYVALTEATLVDLSKLNIDFDGLTIENGQIALTKDGKVVTRLHAEYNDDVTVYVIANGDDVVTATYTGSEFVTKYQTGEYPVDVAASVYALEYPGTIKTLVLKLAVKDPAKVPAV